MTKAITIDDETNKLLENIQKEYNFNNKSEVISKLAKEFDQEELNSKATYLASEKSLARDWLSEEEDKAWVHLQKGM